jgi:uncharacterized membrane protein YeaQ/YmgE (transglycosylase-associated protein family)
MFALIGTIIVGFIVGVITKLIMPGKENLGFIMTTLLGIAGSIAATYIGQAIGWYEAGQGAGWIGSIVGAFVVLWARVHEYEPASFQAVARFFRPPRPASARALVDYRAAELDMAVPSSL